MTETQLKLQEIVEWLNENYNQDSENYSIFAGAKPEVIRYDEHTAISLWGCGAIVCIKSIMYFISEDDGNWFCSMYYDGSDLDEDGCLPSYVKNRPDMGLQGIFSIGWTDSFTTAMLNLKKYVEENGTPVYYSGTKTICHFTL